MDWQAQPDAVAVEAIIRRSLPQGASPEAVAIYLESVGVEHSDFIEGMIYASAPAKSDLPMVGAKWLVCFSFTDGRLAHITVDKGLTGA